LILADKFHALSPGHQFAAWELLGILKTEMGRPLLTGSICNAKAQRKKARAQAASCQTRWLNLCKTQKWSSVYGKSVGEGLVECQRPQAPDAEKKTGGSYVLMLW
jgi:hypothetical protein